MKRLVNQSHIKEAYNIKHLLLITIYE